MKTMLSVTYFFKFEISWFALIFLIVLISSDSVFLFHVYVFDSSEAYLPIVMTYKNYPLLRSILILIEVLSETLRVGCTRKNLYIADQIQYLSRFMESMTICNRSLTHTTYKNLFMNVIYAFVFTIATTNDFKKTSVFHQ